MMHWGHQVTGTFTHDNDFFSHLPSQHGFKFNGSKTQFIGSVQILWDKSNTIHLMDIPNPIMRLIPFSCGPHCLKCFTTYAVGRLPSL